jgi:hypothetical protein
VRNPDEGQTGELVAYYEFTNNANDLSGNGNNGLLSDCIYVDDMFGVEKNAIKFNVSFSKVSVANNDMLNFRDGLTVSYWVNINQFFEHESYPVSHGNWINRWKTSLTDRHLRFTINGSNGTIDVDSKTKLETGNWYHIVALFNGTDCLVFVNGKPDGYKSFEGKINTTTYDLVLGQSLPGQDGFNFNGTMDKFRLYNYGISYEKVKEIYESELSSVPGHSFSAEGVNIYPNPVKNDLQLEILNTTSKKLIITLLDISGATLWKYEGNSSPFGIFHLNIPMNDYKSGMYFVSIIDGEKHLVKKIAKTE